MPLNMADRVSALENIRPRIKGALLTYAGYLLSLASPTAGQLEWARNAIRSPDSYVDQVSRYFLYNGTYIDSGSSLTDSDIDFVVQTTINAHFIVEPPAN